MIQKPILIPIVLLIWYCNSPLCFNIGFILLSVCFYKYILNFTHFADTSILVIFLNKLNNATLNPIIFLIILGIVKSYFYYKYSTVNHKYILLVCLITIMSYVDITIPNYIGSCVLLPSFAATLTNGLLIIHPLILYTFYSLLIGLSTYHYYSTRVMLLKVITFYPYLPVSSKLYAPGVIALFLGAWWSYQELNWGGFWSWDLVEVFLLVTVTYATVLQHRRTYSKYSTVAIIFFLINFVVYIISVRYNLINSIHNFISQANFSYKITYILVIISAVLIYFKFRLVKLGFFRWKNTQYTYPVLLLESLYVVLVFYIILTYIGFYVARTSSTVFINIVPIIIYTLWASLLTSYCTGIGLYLPFVESLLLSVVVKLNLNLTRLSFLHVSTLILFIKLTIYYNLILLCNLPHLQDLMYLISLNSVALLDMGVSTTCTNSDGARWEGLGLINLYIDACTPKNLLQTSYSSVVYPTTLYINNYSAVIFAHKFFAKISLVEVMLTLALILSIFLLINLGKKLVIKF